MKGIWWREVKMKQELISSLTKSFAESAYQEEEVEFWYARYLQQLLGYIEWRKFLGVIEKAKEACKNSGNEVQDHFVEAAKMVKIGSETERNIDDFMLTRYACYLIAQNGDPRKEQIAFAQSYFAVKNRKQELDEKWWKRNCWQCWEAVENEFEIAMEDRAIKYLKTDDS